MILVSVFLTGSMTNVPVRFTPQCVPFEEQSEKRDHYNVLYCEREFLLRGQGQE